jgi:hypothetical protein
MRPLTILSLSATLTAVLSAAAPPTIKVTEPIEISKLNECIQSRFVIRSNVFGISRIGPPRVHQMGSFQPENATETAAVDQLRQKELEVAVFLVGRQALNEQATATAPFASRRTGLQGPVSITLRPDTRLPDATAVFSKGQSALASALEDQGYAIKSGNWTLAMRPLRASNQTCVGCHSYRDAPPFGVASGAITPAPKLGDVLGVVIYAYRQGTKANTPLLDLSPRP